MKRILKIGEIGQIESGEYSGWQIEVVDDRDFSGGFFILINEDFNKPTAKGHDDWVESMDALEKYFEEANWDIRW